MKLIQTYNIAIKSGEFAGYYRMCGIDSMEKARCDKMTAAEQIKALRNLCGMTQAEFAAEFEIPKRTIESWEAGDRVPPPYVIRLIEHAVRSLQASE